MAVAVAGVAGERRVGAAVLLGCGAGLFVVAPLPTLAFAFLAWATLRFRNAAAAARADKKAKHDAVEAAELIGLGLAGGLSVGAAHRAALSHAPATVCPSLEELITSMEEMGIVAALEADKGPTVQSSRVLAAVSASGAPALPALRAQIEAEHGRRHAAEVERARRLPIRLMLPLTLLVLPGFVVITVGPAVIDSLARLAP